MVVIATHRRSGAANISAEQQHQQVQTITERIDKNANQKEKLQTKLWKDDLAAASTPTTDYGKSQHLQRLQVQQYSIVMCFPYSLEGISNYRAFDC